MKAWTSRFVMVCLVSTWLLKFVIPTAYAQEQNVSTGGEGVSYDKVHSVPQFIWKESEFAFMDHRKHFLGREDVNILPKDCWLNQEVAQKVLPKNACGQRGNVWDRVRDCANKNPASWSTDFPECNPALHGWMLVAKAETGEEVWLDMANELLISDIIIDDNNNDQFNWCWAGGSNEKIGGRYSTKDPDGYCSNPLFQDQQNPVSLCYEDSAELFTPEYTKKAKGNLNYKEGVYWYLPTIEDYAWATNQGMRQAVPNIFTSDQKPNIFWSSTILANAMRTKNVWQLHGNNGALGVTSDRTGKAQVRCVAPIPPKQGKTPPRYKDHPDDIPQFDWNYDIPQFLGTKNPDHFVDLIEVERYPKDCWCGIDVWREKLDDPTEACGLDGPVTMRMIDCAEKNPKTYMKILFECQQAKWQLVVKTKTGEEVWLDHFNKMLVSDLVVSDSGKFRFNWCHASGTNGKFGSKYGSYDLVEYCNVGHFQDQAYPQSLCFEDPTELYTPEYTKRAKGFLSTNQDVYWFLPTSRQYAWAATYGIRKVVQNMVRPLHPEMPSYVWSYWTSSVWSKYPAHAWRFLEKQGVQDGSATRNNEVTVRCFARMPDEFGFGGIGSKNDYKF